MKVTFTKWEERVAASGAVPKRVRYTRKSTESDEKQVGSHDLQGAAADREWGPIDLAWTWQDNFTGTTFERPAFQDLMRFCVANPQPRHDPGRIEMYDPSRFGRILDEDGKPDVLAFQKVHGDLRRLGWLPQFVTMKSSGDSFADVLMLYKNAHLAAEFSVILSRNVTRGNDQARFGGLVDRRPGSVGHDAQRPGRRPNSEGA